MKTVKFHTLGCKVNQYETQSIRERFLSKGFTVLENGEPAEVFVVNTCTVTQTADRKSRWAIRRAIRQNPRAKIIVTGCLVQRDWRDVAAIKGVDYIISKSFFPPGIKGFSGRTRAFLKIQDGCRNRCSFCKVGLIRGPLRSRPPQEVIREANTLVEAGFKEIVLTGICLGAYGRDIGLKSGLVKIINKLEKIKGLLRIRLSSIEAADISDELIDSLSESPILCPYLHIPFQSADDQILKRMNKTLRRDDYLRLISRLRKRISNFALTADIMVGFPGEKEYQFKNTVDFIRQARPLKVHIFPYSKREGTAAYSFKEAVPQHIIKQRLEYLEGLCREVSLDFRRDFIGRRLEVLIEGRASGDPSMYEGYSRNYIKIRVKAPSSLMKAMANPGFSNRVIAVTLREVYDNFCLAEYTRTPAAQCLTL